MRWQHSTAEQTASTGAIKEAASPLRFVSSEWRSGRPQPPERRIPICFPNITLQMMKLTDEQLEQVKETGWLREVAFKTTPEVTKLEIAAFLESVYGMSVERVSTINYLGRRRLTIARNGKRLWWREDDWKKAYVIFRPPPGQEHLLSQGRHAGGEDEGDEQQQQRPVIEQIREAARAPRLPPRPWPWERRPGSGRRGPPGGGAEA
ncbi:hypothetical protein HYH02_005208 [Chlamydomonas schloesseri]|uniref:Large ribosomal subunit protein uL23c n=1 Tax=Chlamydomonas schloesseri TaxID=2026947 RepID=A0A836B7Q6_9CHLO|nr:hypothetical protein HYH02_005208 [Chlamydomonas schloesseri]|eukprot:KAG2449679.1 hypothetical protein HYH02_005208 [Chlamydomonas schloesseri]